MNQLEKWSVWISATATSVSGVGLFWAKYLIDNPDPWAVVNHPLEPWLLKVHVVAAPLLVFALGLIASKHIWRHYRAGLRWGRRSGIVTALVTIPMILSGYLIQVLTDLGWLKAMALAHITLGFLFAAGLALHQVFVRQRAAAEARVIAASRDPEMFAGTG